MFILSLKLAVENLKQRVFSRILLITTSACLLVITGVLLVGLQSFSKSLAEIKSSQYITVYIEPSLEESKEKGLLSAVQKLSGVKDATLVSKNNFLDNFSKYFPDLTKDLAAIDSDTIPRFIKIKTNTENTDELEIRLKKMSGVESSESNKNRYQGMISAFEMMRKVCVILLFGVSVALVSLLFNHLKAASHFKLQLRKTLLSIGAKKRYLILPLSLEAIIEGVGAGAIAAVVLVLLGGKITSGLNELFVQIGYKPFQFEFHSVALVLVGIGIISGTLVALLNLVTMEKA